MPINEAKAREIGLNAGEIGKLEELVREGYIGEAEAENLIDAGEIGTLEDEIEEAEHERTRDRERSQGRVHES